MRSIAFALVLIAGAAFGQQTTLTYSGAPMTGTLVGASSSADYTIISGTVVLSAPLAANQANQTVTPVSFSFNGDAKLSSQYVSYPAAAVFEFTTVNGVITDWTVMFDFSMDSTTETIALMAAGDNYSYLNQAPSCPPPGNNPCPNWTNWTASNSARGTWSVGGVVMSAADPPAACAAPPAATPPPAQPVAPAPAVAATTPTTPHFRGVFEGRR
jgi:hypothetical protein